MTEVWDPIPRTITASRAVQDEIILRNTFVNAQMILTSEQTLDADGAEPDPVAQNLNQQKIVWNHANLVQFAKEGESGTKTVAKHREVFRGKSILKKAAAAVNTVVTAGGIKQEEIDSMISLN